MIRIATLACALLVAAAVTAAPAHATLFVKSDSTGLTIQDKNNLGDQVIITSETLGGAPVYLIVSGNPLDIIKFDRGPGCSAGATGNKVTCQRASSKLNLAMAGGDDKISASQSGAVTASVSLGTGNDQYGGINGKDTVDAGFGDDDVTTNSGDDDISPGTDGVGSDSVSAGPGKDRIREGEIVGESWTPTAAAATTRSSSWPATRTSEPEAAMATTSSAWRRATTTSSAETARTPSPRALATTSSR